MVLVPTSVAHCSRNSSQLISQGGKKTSDGEGNKIRLFVVKTGMILNMENLEVYVKNKNKNHNKTAPKVQS